MRAVICSRNSPKAGNGFGDASMPRVFLIQLHTASTQSLCGESALYASVKGPLKGSISSALSHSSLAFASSNVSTSAPGMSVAPPPSITGATKSVAGLRVP